MTTEINILLATRPLTPPWDEASKNFAYFLAKKIRDPHLKFHLLTTETKLEGLGDNCIQHPIFAKSHFDQSEKIRLARFLFLKSQQFDIIHYLFTPTPLNSFLIKYLTINRPRSIQTVATLREEQWNETDWKKMLFADQLAVYTKHSKERLETAGFSHVTQIYPGIDLNYYCPTPKNPETLKALNLSHNDFVVSYAGEYARLGATDMIVDMLTRHLPHKSKVHENFKFLFALRIKNDADAQKKHSLKKIFRQAGILDFIRFSDTVFDVPSLYNVADIVTFPVSNMHGKFDVPLVILEAYACGKPVILSDLPLFREFSHSEISTTIPRNNGDALWEQIEELRKDTARAKRLGENARTFVEKHFNLETTAEEYANLYRNTMKKQR